MVLNSCSWCHTIPPTDDARLCAECGHELNVPRTECRCSSCRLPFAAAELAPADSPGGRDPSQLALFP